MSEDGDGLAALAGAVLSRESLRWPPWSEPSNPASSPSRAR